MWPRHTRPKCRASTIFGNDMKLVDSRDKPGHDEVVGEKRLLGLDQVFRLELVERAGLGPAPMLAL